MKVKLPPLFQAIIEHDAEKPKGVVVKSKVFIAWKRRKIELIQAAERFVANQRKP